MDDMQKQPWCPEVEGQYGVSTKDIVSMKRQDTICMGCKEADGVSTEEPGFSG